MGGSGPAASLTNPQARLLTRQPSLVQHDGMLCSVVQYNAMSCAAVSFSNVQCCAVQDCTVSYSVVLYIALECYVMFNNVMF